MTDWRVSSYSKANGNCVQVAPGILVRDSRNPEGPVLSFTPGAWRAFTTRLHGSTWGFQTLSPGQEAGIYPG